MFLYQVVQMISIVRVYKNYLIIVKVLEMFLSSFSNSVMLLKVIEMSFKIGFIYIFYFY